MILAASNNLKPILKMFFTGPRPYWMSAKIQAFVAESSFGIPSGHAQDAVAVWGTLAFGTRKRWAWAAAVTLAFFIGFSRLYLGAHFVHDVFAGWFIGALLLWVFTRFWDSTAAWLKTQSLMQQILISFIISLIAIVITALIVGRFNGYTFPEEWQAQALRAGPVPEPVSMEASITAAATFFGLAAGMAWLAARGGYQADGPIEKRALRYVIGLIGVVILWRGLALFLPNNTDFVSYTLRYVRYTLVGFWVTAGAPLLFFFFLFLEKTQM